MSRVSNRERLHLIFSGWGNDYDQAQAYVAKHGLQDQVTFLPFSLSKPLLAEFFSLVDFAADQFCFMGTYGTALVEALAAGCPTLMWIEESSFVARGWEPPPVINAESEADIVCKLELIACGSIDLEDVSQRSQAWIGRMHAPEAVLPKILSCFVKIQTDVLEVN
jgi:glycosyltransferase involved in cell wall biosynthesis